MNTQLTVEEREERTERDGGDPKDTVWLKPLGTPGMARVYHADSECRYIAAPDMAVETTREKAQRALKAPCSVCVLDDAGTGGEDEQPRCHICHEKVSSLVGHLHGRGCPGPSEKWKKES